MSSPKESDYQIAGENKVIKKSIVPIIRIVVKNTNGVKELKGTSVKRCSLIILMMWFKADRDMLQLILMCS